MPYDLQLENEPDAAAVKKAADDKAKADADAKLKADADAKTAADEAQAKQVADAEEARKAAEDRNAQLLQAYIQTVSAGQQPTDEQKRAAAKQETNTPGWEDNPEAFIADKIEQGIQKGVAAAIQPIKDQYGRDRTMNLNTAIDQRRAQLRADKEKFPHYAELESELMEFEKNFQPDELARPGALEEVYYRCIGRKNVADLASKSVRDQGPESGGRQTGSVNDASGDTGDEKLNDEEKFFANKDGLKTADFRALQGKGSFNIDDYKRLKAGA